MALAKFRKTFKNSKKKPVPSLNKTLKDNTKNQIKK